MQTPVKLSSHLSSNIHLLKELLPIGTSFDLITRELYLRDTQAFFLGVNGFIKTEILQQIFSDLQNPLFTQDPTIDDLVLFMQSKIGYAQVELTSDIDKILKQVLSGPILLLVDGFDQAIIIRTETKVIMFSRDIWFSEDITISEHDDYNSIFPISQVVDSWSDDGENKVNVIRTSRKL